MHSAKKSTLAVVKPGDDRSIFSVKIKLVSIFWLEGVQTRCIGVDSLKNSAISGLKIFIFVF